MNRKKQIKRLEYLADSHFNKRIRFIHDKHIVYIGASALGLILLPIMNGIFLIGFAFFLIVIGAALVTEVMDAKEGECLSGSWETQFLKALNNYRPINRERYDQLQESIRLIGLNSAMIENWISFEWYDANHVKE